MKKRFFILLLIYGVNLLFFQACTHEPDDTGTPPCSAEGLIIGLDYRLCACCGGWFIEIAGDTLRAQELPPTFTDSLDHEEFPLAVYLDWAADETPCLGDEIDVFCIERKE